MNICRHSDNSLLKSTTVQFLIYVWFHLLIFTAAIVDPADALCRADMARAAYHTTATVALTVTFSDQFCSFSQFLAGGIAEGMQKPELNDRISLKRVANAKESFWNSD